MPEILWAQKKLLLKFMSSPEARPGEVTPAESPVFDNSRVTLLAGRDARITPP